MTSKPKPQFPVYMAIKQSLLKKYSPRKELSKTAVFSDLKIYFLMAERPNCTAIATFAKRNIHICVDNLYSVQSRGTLKRARWLLPQKEEQQTLVNNRGCCRECSVRLLLQIYHICSDDFGHEEKISVHPGFINTVWQTSWLSSQREYPGGISRLGLHMEPHRKSQRNTKEHTWTQNISLRLSLFAADPSSSSAILHLSSTPGRAHSCHTSKHPIMPLSTIANVRANMTSTFQIASNSKWRTVRQPS